MSKKDKTDKVGFLTGFKNFITKGNILDLAIGVVMGGAFGAVINSLVKDIIMPFIAALMGQNSFEDLVWILRGTPIKWGVFVQSIIQFFIIAFTIYLVFVVAAKGLASRAKAAREARKHHETPISADAPQVAAPVETETELLTEIRDLLKEQTITKDR